MYKNGKYIRMLVDIIERIDCDYGTIFWYIDGGYNTRDNEDFA